MDINTYINKNRAPKIISVTLAAALGLAACSSVEIEAKKPSTVIEHVYHAPYVTFIYSGKTMIPMSHPEQFGLDIQQCGDEEQKHANEDGCVEKEVLVTKATYDQYKDGDTITFDKNQ